MLYRVETGPRAGLDDTQGRKTAQHLRKALNISVSGVRQIKVFTVDGLDAAQVGRLLDESIWHDPILQDASLEPLPLLDTTADWFVEVGFRPGVTDNEARTARDTATSATPTARKSFTTCRRTRMNGPTSPANPAARTSSPSTASGCPSMTRPSRKGAPTAS